MFYFDDKDIDEMNIYKATYTAMHKALDNLQVRPELILVDGNSFIPYYFEGEQQDHVCITKGDNIYSSIAAASILAKVERDKYIYDLCDKYDYLDDKYKIKSNKVKEELGSIQTVTANSFLVEFSKIISI